MLSELILMLSGQLKQKVIKNNNNENLIHKIKKLNFIFMLSEQLDFNAVRTA
jgi:hypothetical protein